MNTDGPMGRGLSTGTGEQVQGRVRVWQVPPPTGIEGLYLSPVVPSSAPWVQPTPGPYSQVPGGPPEAKRKTSTRARWGG